MKKNLILIVEDDLPSCELFRELFEKEKIEPFKIVHDGEQAIEVCKAQKDIQMVLMDIRLPGINGCEALKEIRKIHKNIPVIVQTACVYEGDKEKYISYGFNDYICKPIIAKTLIAIINKHQGNCLN